jgi:hypothetical protein
MTSDRGIMGIFHQNWPISNVLVVWGPKSECWQFVGLVTKRVIIWGAKL